MAFLPTGSRTVAGGIYPSIRKHLKNVNLLPVKKLTVTFDPFGHNANYMRQFLFSINNRFVLRTNPYCKINCEISCDRSEPTIHYALMDGNTVTLKCNNLDVLEMIKLTNEHVSSLMPKEEVVTEEVVKIKRR